MTLCLLMAVFCLGNGIPVASAQDTVHLRPAREAVREIPAEDIEEYRSQSAFQYDRQSVKGEGLWDRFWSWVWDTYNEAMSRKGVRKGFDIFLKLASVALLLYFLSRLSGRDVFAPWKKGGGIVVQSSELEDIHAVDHDRVIAEAVAAERYREAVRLQYLKSLKRLADRGVIAWAPRKTNAAYLEELQGSRFRQGFAGITRVYEYAWYGEMPVPASAYARISSMFEDFNQSVGT